MTKLRKDDVMATISFTSNKIALAGIGVAALGLLTKNKTIKAAAIVTSFTATIVENITDKIYQKYVLDEIEKEDLDDDGFDFGDDIDYDDYSDPLDDLIYDDGKTPEEKPEEKKKEEKVEEKPSEESSNEGKPSEA